MSCGANTSGRRGVGPGSERRGGRGRGRGRDRRGHFTLVRPICPKEILHRIPPRTLCFSRATDATRRAGREGGRAHRSVGRQAPFFRVLARLRQRAYATRSLLPLTAPTLSRNLKAERRLDHATEILFIWGPTSNCRPPTRHRKSERESATKDEREDGRTRTRTGTRFRPNGGTGERILAPL